MVEIVDRNEYIYRYMRRKAYKRFNIKPVRVRHLNELMKDPSLDIRRSRPGIPYEPICKTTAEVFDSGTARYGILEFWAKVRRESKILAPHCIVSYPNDSENATANVRPECKYPAAIAIGEAQFALPLIKGFLEDNKTPVAYAFGIPTEGPRCLRGPLPPTEFYGGCKFENFDESVRYYLIRDAFFVLQQNFELGSYEGMEIPNIDDMNRQYSYIMSYYLNTPIYCERSKEVTIMTGHFPSGSHFTPLIDIVLYWMLATYGYLKCFNNYPTNKQIFGDRYIKKPSTMK